MDDNYDYSEISRVVDGVYSLYVPRLRYSYDKTKLLDEEIDIPFSSDVGGLVVESVDITADDNLLANGDVEYLTIKIFYSETFSNKYNCSDIYNVHFENDSLVYENNSCSSDEEEGT